MSGSRVGLVVSWTSDLFLRSRIGELAGSLGLTTLFVSDIKELRELVSQRTMLVILDLASYEYDSITVVKTLKEEWPRLLVLGFYPHVRKDLEAKAKDVGVDFVVPNSSFLKSLRKILETWVDKS